MIAVLAAAVLAATPTIDATFWRPVGGHHHHRRRHRPKPPAPTYRTALASWYALHGGGACGVGDVQSGYRFASRTLSCGTRVTFCHARCVTAVMSDRGPYVYDRLFDLNANLRYALGCPDLCAVRWRIT